MNPRKFRRIVLFVIAAATRVAAQGRADDFDGIRSNMNFLAPLVGKWTAVAEFHQPDGSLRYSEGTYEIAPVLEGTYLKADVAMHRKEDPTKQRSFLIFTTFNPQSGKYNRLIFTAGGHCV